MPKLAVRGIYILDFYRVGYIFFCLLICNMNTNAVVCALLSGLLVARRLEIKYFVIDRTDEFISFLCRLTCSLNFNGSIVSKSLLHESYSFFIIVVFQRSSSATMSYICTVHLVSGAAPEKHCPRSGILL